MTWKDITLQQYEDILQILQDESDDFIRTSRVVKVVFDINLEEIPITEINGYFKEISDLLNKPIQKNKPKKKYKIGNNTYVLNKFEDMNLAQFMDYHELSKDVDNNINKICAIFLIPEGKKYNTDYSLEDVEQDMWNLPIEDVTGIAFFQVGQLKKLLKNSLSSLIAQMITMKGINWKQKKETIKALYRVWKSMDYLIS